MQVSIRSYYAPKWCSNYVVVEGTNCGRCLVDWGWNLCSIHRNPRLLVLLGISDFPTPFTLRIDNQAAIIFADDHSRVSILKHIDTRQCWVKKMRDRGTMIPWYVPSADNKAGLLTKAHNRPMRMHRISPMMNLNGVHLKEAYQLISSNHTTYITQSDCDSTTIARSGRQYRRGHLVKV